MAGDFDELMRLVTERLRERTGAIKGAIVEAKRSSVAVHYRLVDERDRSLVKAAVDRGMATGVSNVTGEWPGDKKSK